MSPVSRSSHWSALKTLLFVLLPVFVLMIVFLGFAKLSDVPVTNLLRDPNAVLGGAFYVGLFSTAGIALWAAAAAICVLLLSAGVEGQPRTLLTAGAVVSLVAGVDDAYLIHETLPVRGILYLYGFVTVVLFWRTWRYLIRRPNVSVFVASIVMFALAFMLDFKVLTIPRFGDHRRHRQVSWYRRLGHVLRWVLSRPDHYERNHRRRAVLSDPRSPMTQGGANDIA